MMIMMTMMRETTGQARSTKKKNCSFEIVIVGQRCTSEVIEKLTNAYDTLCYRMIGRIIIYLVWTLETLGRPWRPWGMFLGAEKENSITSMGYRRSASIPILSQHFTTLPPPSCFPSAHRICTPPCSKVLYLEIASPPSISYALELEHSAQLRQHYSYGVCTRNV